MRAPTKLNERWSIDPWSKQTDSDWRLRISTADDGFSRLRVGQLVATSVSGLVGALPG